VSSNICLPTGFNIALNYGWETIEDRSPSTTMEVGFVLRRWRDNRESISLTYGAAKNHSTNNLGNRPTATMLAGSVPDGNTGPTGGPITVGIPVV
jgi:hypothetical protein